MIDFAILSWRAVHTTEEAAASLERQRQKMLADPWRPRFCAVPFAPAEARDYKEPCLDDPVPMDVARTFRELATRDIIAASVENALARRAIREMNDEAAREADKVETPIDSNIVKFQR